MAWCYLRLLVSTLVFVSVLGPTQISRCGQLNILMILWRGHTETEVVYQDQLAAMGIKADFVEINGDQNQSALAGKLREMEAELEPGKYALIYSYGTTVTRMAVEVNKGRVPMVFNIVYDPLAAGLVESLERPGGNLTGVTNGAPMAEQLDTFYALKPFKNMVLAFTSREANANLILDRVTSWAQNKGVKLTALRVAPETDSLDRGLADIKSGAVPCDMLYAGADTYLASRAKDINAAIGQYVPLFGGTGTFVKYGWLGAYTPPLEDMGRAAAQLTKEILEGQKADNLPVILPRPRIILSKSAAGRFGVDIPEKSLTED